MRLNKPFLARAFIMGLRIVTLGSRFALTFFIAHYIGLAALGLYGLVSGASALLPALLGLGTNGILNRHVVDIPLKEAMPHMITRLTFNVVLYAALIPCFIFMAAQGWVDNISAPRAALIGLIVFSEHMGIDIHGQLMGRHRANLANFLLFVRGGAWVAPFLLVGWFLPAYRSLDTLFAFWLGSSVVLWGILATYLARKHRWRHIGLNWRWLRESIWRGRPFFLFDIGNVGSQYLDRFIITLFLGLEMTGVYTFFWSLTNAVNSLIYYGIIQLHAPRMIGAKKHGDNRTFRRMALQLQKEVWTVSFILALGLWLLSPWIVALLRRPLLDANLWAFAIMMIATMIRLGADALNTVLYAQNKDRAMATIALIAIAVATLFNLAGAWSAGFTGVVWAYLAGSIIVFALRAGYVWPEIKKVATNG